MSGDRFRTAVAAGALAGDELHRALLQSLVETARAIFKAKASSIFLLDEEADELVFEAVAGEGSDTLVGRRLPSSTGIAGWVLTSRQPIVVDDVTADPRFAQDAAESTGYVPKGLMAAPLLHEERALGVLSVLDRPKTEKFTLAEMELLGYFANQAAVALELLLAARRAQSALGDVDDRLGLVAQIASDLEALPPERQEAGMRLLRALGELLRP
jgi:GAF domain-containing protein